MRLSAGKDPETNGNRKLRQLYRGRRATLPSPPRYGEGDHPQDGGGAGTASGAALPPPAVMAAPSRRLPLPAGDRCGCRAPQRRRTQVEFGERDHLDVRVPRPERLEELAGAADDDDARLGRVELGRDRGRDLVRGHRLEVGDVAAIF